MPFHCGITPVEIQRTYMEEAMDIVESRFFPILTLTIRRYQSTVYQTNPADDSIKDLFCESREFVSSGASLWKVIKQLVCQTRW